jgi:Putative transposase DNA-binding domain
LGDFAACWRATGRVELVTPLGSCATSRPKPCTRWFPSSKTCCCCGSVKAELALSQRLFRCSECGFEADRDWNAAKNLETLAASSAVSACGEERSGAVRKSRVKRSSVKQEPNLKGELCAAELTFV